MTTSPPTRRTSPSRCSCPTCAPPHADNAKVHDGLNGERHRSPWSSPRAPASRTRRKRAPTAPATSCWPADRTRLGSQSAPWPTDILNTWAKISLSDVDNKRGYEMTVTGSGFNNGTTAGVYVLPTSPGYGPPSGGRPVDCDGMKDARWTRPFVALHGRRLRKPLQGHRCPCT